MNNITKQFDGAFHALGYGHLSVFAKMLVLYLIISVGKFKICSFSLIQWNTGAAAVTVLTVVILNKIEQKLKGKKTNKHSEEDSEIEQEEQEDLDPVIRKKNN